MERTSKELKKQKEQLEKEIASAKWQETKLMWKHANWFWRIVLIVGILTLIRLWINLMDYIITLIG